MQIPWGAAFGEIEKARGENSTEVKCDCQYTDGLPMVLDLYSYL